MSDKVLSMMGRVLGNNPASNAGNYVKNVGMSTYYGYGKVVADKMPNLMKMIDVNKQTVQDVANIIKNPMQLGSSLNSIIDGSKVLKQTNEILKNAMDDVKSGKFYDPARDRTEEGMKTEALLNSFGGFDMSGFDESGNYSEPVSSDADAITSAISDSTAIQEDNADTRFRLKIQSDVSNTQAIIENDQAIAKLDLKTRLKEHSNIMNMTSSHISLTAAQLEFQNNQTVQHYNIMKETASIVSDTLPKMLSVLTSIENILRTSATGGSASGVGNGMRSMMSASQNEERSVFTRGVFDVKKYFKNTVDRADKQIGISSTASMLLFGMKPDEFLEIFKSNPLEDLWTAALGSFIPKATKNMASILDKSLGAFFPALLQKFNADGKGDGTKAFLSKILGVDVDSRKTIDTRYDLDANVKFDAVVYKTIVDVIPFRLGQIVSLLSGQKETIFDHSTGKYVDRVSAGIKIREDSESLLGGVSGTMNKLENMMSTFVFESREQEDTIRQDMKKMMQTIVEKNELFNPHTAKYDNLGTDLKGRDKSFEFIKGLMKAMNRTDLLNFNKESFEALMSRDERIKKLADDTMRNGLMSLFAEGNSSETEIFKNTKLFMTEKDKHEVMKKNGYDPESRILNHSVPGILKDILNTLRMGIIVYPQFDLDKGDMRPVLDEVKKISTGLYETLYSKPYLLESDKLSQEYRDRQYQLNEATERSKDKTFFTLNGDKMNSDFISSAARSAMEVENEKRRVAELAVLENSMFGKFLDSFKFGRIIKSAHTKVNKMTNDPFAFITKAMESVDKKIYGIIYGSEDSEVPIDMPFNEKSGEDKSFMGKLFKMMKFNFMTFKTFLVSNILDPLYEKLIGTNGIFTKLGEKLDPVKGKLKSYGLTKTKEFANYLLGDLVDDYDDLDGATFGPNGEVIYKKKRQGGLLSSASNKVKSITDKIKSEAMSQSKAMWSSTKEAMFGKGWVNKMNANGQEYLEEDKGLLGGLLDTIKGVKKSMIDTLLGEDQYNMKTGKFEPTRSRKMWNSMMGEFKGFMPKGVVGAGLGAGAFLGGGLLTGLFLPGGPLFAAMLGSSVAFVKHSDKVREYLFGKEDGTKDGVINREIVDGFKKFAPKIGLGAGIGAAVFNFGLIEKFGILGSALLPGGPILGAFLGSIAGLTVASTSLKKALFGDGNVGEDGKFSEEYKKKMTDKIATMVPLGAGGFMLGSMISNFGLLGAIPGMQFLGVGAAIAAMANADDIKHYFFGGGKDKNGEPKKGIFDKFVDFGKRELFDPFINSINEVGKSIQGWFKEAIVSPLAEGMGPIKEEMKRSSTKIKEAFGNFGGWMKGGIDKVFEENFGAKLEELVKQYVTDPIKKLFGDIMRFIGKMLGGLISMPFKAIGSIGKSLEAKHRREDFRTAISEGLQSIFKPKNKDGKNIFDRMSDLQDKFDEKMASAGIFLFSKMMDGKNKVEKGLSSTGKKINEKTTEAYFAGKGLLSRFGAWMMNGQNPAVLAAYGAKASDTQTPNIAEAYNALNSSRIDNNAVSRANSARARHEEQQAKKAAEDKKKADAKAKKENEAKDRLAAADAEARNRDLSLKKSNNPVTILKGILQYTRSIFLELKGNMDGLGWNLAYIRNILIKNFGKPDLEPDVKSFKGGRPKGVIRKAWDFVTTPFKAIGEKIADTFNVVKDKTIEIVLNLTNPFKLLFKGMKLAWDGIVGTAGLIKDMAHGIFETVLALGPAVINLASSALYTVGKSIELGMKSLINTVETGFVFIKGIFEGLGNGLGAAVGALATGIGHTISLLANFGGLLVDLTSVVLPKLVGGIMDLTGKFAELVISIPFKIVAGLYDFITNGINLSILPFYVNGGHLDLVKVVERVGFGESIMNMAPIAMIRGIAASVPKWALPVYIAGWAKSIHFNSDSESESGNDRKRLKYNSTSRKLDEIISILVGGTMITPEGYTVPLAAMRNDNGKDSIFKKFTDDYKSTREKLRSGSNKGKILNNVISEISDEASAKAAGTSLSLTQTEAALETNNLLGSFINGPGGKGGGALSLLGIMSSLFAGPLGWLASTLKSVVSGDWWQLLENSARRGIIAKSILNPIFNKFVKPALDGFMDNTKPFFEGLQTGIKNIFDSKWIRGPLEKFTKTFSKLALNFEIIKDNFDIFFKGGARQIGEDGVKGVSRLAYEKSSRYFGAKGMDSFLDIGKKSLYKNYTAAKGANVINSGAVKPNIIQKIMKGIEGIITSPQIRKAVGKKGLKMLEGAKKALKTIAVKLGQIVIGKQTLAKIMGRIAGGPANLAFCAYDLTTGMAEAANIFEVGGNQVTFKMRIVAGLSKMISGTILFGLIPDSWIASILWAVIADEDEKEAVNSAKKGLENDWKAYRIANNSDISFDEYNDKIANKRVFTKIVDGAKWGIGKIGDGFNAVGSALSPVVAGIGNILTSSIGATFKWIFEPFKDLGKTLLDLRLFFTEGFSSGISALFKNLIKFVADVILFPFRPLIFVLEKIGGVFGIKPIMGQQSSSYYKEPDMRLAESSGISDIAKTMNTKKYGLKNSTVAKTQIFGKGSGDIATIDPSKKISGLSHFLQNDSRWADKQYGFNDTLKESGCAPAIAASLISNYNQRTPISPEITAKFAVDNGFKLKNNGTDSRFFEAIGRKYNIRIYQGIKNGELIISQLRQGKPVIVMGRRLSKDSAYSGTSMHYMLLSAYDENRKEVVIQDPTSETIRYANILTVLKDTSLVFFTESKGQGMRAKYVPQKTNTLDSVEGLLTGKTKPIAKNTKDFISKILGGAISGFNKYGVLPSITLAQAILESGSGKYSIGNNIFGIKAGRLWDGLKRLVWTSEYENGQKVSRKSFFRDYNSIDASIEDHARLLTNKRYAKVLKAQNYRDAANAVHSAGYATDPAYASKLIKIIEQYGLFNYDNPNAEWGKGIDMNTYYVQRALSTPSYTHENRQIIDGIPFFFQKDPRWAKKAYGPTTVGESGCAPVSLASISTAYKYPVNPINIADFVAKNPSVIAKNGGTTDKLFELWGRKSGIKFKSTGNSMGIEFSIMDNLLKRKPVILMGRQNGVKSPYSSKNMHYLIASSYNKQTKMVTIIDGANPTGAPRYVPLSSILRDTVRYTFTEGANGNGILGYDPIKKTNDEAIAKAKAAEAKAKALKATTPTTAVEKNLETLWNFGSSENAVPTTSGANGYDGLMESLGSFMNAAASSRWGSVGNVTDYFLNKIRANRDSTGTQSYNGTALGLGEGMMRELSAELKNSTQANPIMPLNKYSQAYSKKSNDFVLGDTDIHAFFGNRLYDLARYGLNHPLEISDGSRNRSEQIAISKKYGPGRAADPWKMSMHYTGMAADIKGLTANTPESLLNKYKLYRPFLKAGNGTSIAEPWHVQPIETKGFDARQIEAKYGSIIDWGKGDGYTARDFNNRLTADANWNYDNLKNQGLGISNTYRDVTEKNIELHREIESKVNAAKLAIKVDEVTKKIDNAISNNDQSMLLQAVIEQTQVLTQALSTLTNVVSDIRDEMRESRSIEDKKLYLNGKKLKSTKNSPSTARTGMTVSSGNGGKMIDSIIKKDRK